MIRTDDSGRGVLSYEAAGVVRRIPIERRGTSKSGNPWTLGGILLEVAEEGAGGSAQLYLNVWGDEKVEIVNRIGVGKNVRVRFHIESREYYSNFRTDVVLDEIEGMSESENFAYGIARKER